MINGIAIGECEDFFGDFDFEEDSLVYHDAPVVGFLVRKISGERYAFFCKTVIEGRLFHWSLVPVRIEENAEEAIRAIDASRSPLWVSVVEDRRTTPYYSTVVMKTAEVPPRIG